MRVLQSFPEGRPSTNPYLLQLVASLRPETEVLGFSWSRALLARYDVLHVHWPERLCRGATPARTRVRRALFALLLRRLRSRRTAVVRTLHNERPHEPGDDREAALLRRLDGMTVAWIRLTPSTEPPEAARADAFAVTIPHGDYRRWFEGMPHPPAERGRLAFAGLIRPYKGVEELIGAFTVLDDDELALDIVGETATPALAERLRSAAAADPRISVEPGYVDDAVLADRIGRAELVVLPYRAMHNSGVALLALSLSRPVLVPENPVTAALAEEVGPGWVLRFRPPFDADALAHGIEASRTATRDRAPDLSARGWPGIAEAHRRVYERAVERVRR